MINFDVLNKLGENYKLECKAANGGVPKSLWESYSAFCNTSSGKIILGLDEKITYINGAKHIDYIPSNLSLDLLNEYQATIWNTLNDSNKISKNILKNNDVYIESFNGVNILIINVPEAKISDKPIFINNNPLNSYKRNHEGDYKCTSEEINAMFRDNDSKSRDSYLTKRIKTTDLCQDSVLGYKNILEAIKGRDYSLVKNDIDTMLLGIGAAAYDEDGNIKVTKAGLLMFGYDYQIRTEFPDYFVDYQDHIGETKDIRWTDRVWAYSGYWSGNLFDFYMKVSNKVTS